MTNFIFHGYIMVMKTIKIILAVLSLCTACVAFGCPDGDMSVNPEQRMDSRTNFAPAQWQRTDSRMSDSGGMDDMMDQGMVDQPTSAEYGVQARSGYGNY